MGTAAGIALPASAPWHAGGALLAFLMWAAMMVAMMTPSAAPMVVAYAGLERMRARGRAPVQTVAAFLAGYLAVWTGFSALAALAQWTLRSLDALTPTLSLASPALAGSVLVVVGAWQLAPVKDACLSTCRSPTSFLMTSWRDGARGALAMGTRHGLYCLGCCWALMAALFAVGVMNLAWVAAIALVVLLEKTVPAGRTLARVAGFALIAWGGWLIAG